MGHTPWLKSFSPETEKEEDHVRTTGASEVTVTHSGKMGITEQHWGAQAHGDLGQGRGQGRDWAEGGTCVGTASRLSGWSGLWREGHSEKWPVAVQTLFQNSGLPYSS